MKNIPRIFKYLRPYWKLVIASALLVILSSGAALLAPWPLKILIDSVLENHPLPPTLDWLVGTLSENRYALLILAVAAGLGIALIDSALTVISDYVNTKIDQHMVLDFRSDLFQHAQRLSLAFHDHRRTGQLIFAINGQADAVARLVMIVPPLAQSVITLVGMVWIIVKIDLPLAFLALTVVPFLYYSIHYYVTHIEKRLREVKGMEGETLQIIHEAISMLRVIVAFGRESYEYRRFREQGERAVDARVKLTVRQTMFSLAVNLITAFGTALVLGFGAYKVLQGQLTVGELLVIMSYIAAVYKPLETISSTVSSIQELLISLGIAFQLLDTDPEIKDAPDAISIRRAAGRITFEDARFSYKNRSDTLRDISFVAEPGQVIAIVGPTGAGKTTLISLIPRFYDPNHGRILFDDRDIRKITIKSLREQISIVQQEPLLFRGTIAENIRYGRLEASMDEIIEAAKDANAHDFIMKLPKKYETEIGERGSQLSGGERQRICVARAFLKDAPILILDEPTSSIDSKTEAVILDALDRLMIGRTTFMVAHRLSTIRNADIILVLDHGEIVERGTHDELLQLGKLYKHLYDVQTAAARRKAQRILEPAVATAAD